MNTSDLDPKGKELYEQNLKNGTAFLTEEGEPCTNAEIVESLTGQKLPPSAEEAIAIRKAAEATTNVREVVNAIKSMKQRAREEFYAILGKSLEHIGISQELAGRVIAAVMAQPTRIRTDFAYKPETGMGVVWGWTNGGAVKLPVALDQVVMGTLVSLQSGKSLKMSGGAGLAGAGERGYWIVAYRLSDAESASAAVDSDVKPARGETPHVLHYDDAPFLPKTAELDVSDTALKNGNDVVSAIDEALKSTSSM